MNHPVRIPDHALASISEQLSKDRAQVFRIHDLAEAIKALELTNWWSLPELEQAPGVRRFTVRAGRTVAGYHLIAGLDPWAEEPGAIVIHVIDIWPDRWPQPS